MEVRVDREIPGTIEAHWKTARPSFYRSYLRTTQTKGSCRRRRSKGGGGRLTPILCNCKKGASVQFVAYLTGKRIDATEMAHAPWRDSVNHPLYETLVRLECELRASRVTRRGRQFFKNTQRSNATSSMSRSRSRTSRRLRLREPLEPVPRPGALVGRRLAYALGVHPLRQRPPRHGLRMGL